MWQGPKAVVHCNSGMLLALLSRLQVRLAPGVTLTLDRLMTRRTRSDPSFRVRCLGIPSPLSCHNACMRLRGCHAVLLLSLNLYVYMREGTVVRYLRFAQPHCWRYMRTADMMKH